MRLTVHILPGNDLDALLAAVESCREVADRIELVDLGPLDPTRMASATRPEDLRGDDPPEESPEEQVRRWHLRLEPLERLSPELASSLSELLSTPPPHQAYRIRRRTFILGRSMQSMGLGPSAPVRLELGPMTLDGDAPPPVLETPIEHHPLPGIDAFLRQEDARPSPSRPSSARRLLTVLPATFLRHYVGGSGWRDGFPGYLWASMVAIAAFLTEMKLWVRDQGGD